MARPEPDVSKVIVSQVDFTSGELDPDVKRGDSDPDRKIELALKTGGRQMSNWRITNAKKIQNRPGRRALFRAGGRTEEVLMAPGQKFFLNFGNAALLVYNQAGTLVFTHAAAWTTNTVANIVYVVIGLSIYIFYADGAPANVPAVLTWDGVSQSSTWTFANFAETVTAGNQKRTLFYRISPQNVTMLPSATTGNITMTFSSAICVAGMNGTRFRFCGRQILCTGFTDTTHLSGTVEEPLPPGQVLTFGVDPSSTFNIADVVIGGTSGAKGIVTAINAGAKTITVQLLQLVTSSTASGGGHGGTGGSTTTAGFVASETVSGPGGSIATTAVATTVPQAVSVWDEEVMNGFRGWPSSGFNDQGRLGLCNFPSVPSGIAWSAFGIYTDFYVDASTPTAAIFNLAPGKSQVLYVAAGPESSEFAFCDNAVYYIPITVTNPLQPGSVAFNLLTNNGAAAVQPRAVEEVILYISSGGKKVMSVQAPGAYYRPYIVDDVSELNTHLFSSPIAIAVPNADSTFPERYIYVLNSNGSIAVGKYSVKNGLVQGRVGWLPWTGNGTPSWVSALGSDVIFTSSYAPGGAAAFNIVEILDDTQYLDIAFLVNSPPAALTPPGGKGPLYFMPNGTVDLIDLGTRFMGTYNIDANGFIIPQNIGGENLSSAQLVAGQPWQAVFEPFLPSPGPGEDRLQRMWRRKVTKAAIAVRNSSGFAWVRFYSGPLGRNLPALGTTMQLRRIPAYFQDDDPTQPVPLREEAYELRTIGRSHDPRVGILKDTSGPLTILDAAFEVTV